MEKEKKEIIMKTDKEIINIFKKDLKFSIGLLWFHF